jgi:hypothetical protein
MGTCGAPTTLLLLGELPDPACVVLFLAWSEILRVVRLTPPRSPLIIRTGTGFQVRATCDWGNIVLEKIQLQGPCFLSVFVP